MDSENLRRFENEVRLARGHHTFVISSEQMSWRYGSTEIQHLAEVCKTYFDNITVVIFLRPQWEAIPSRYWLMLRQFLLWKSFGQWLQEEAMSFWQYDYAQVLDLWSTNFPGAKIQPILMAEAGNFDSVGTFYRDAVMCDPTAVARVSVGRKNQSGSGLDITALRVLNLIIDVWHRVRKIGELEVAAIRAKRRLVRMVPLAKGFKSYKISKRRSRQIVRHFMPANQLLSAKYFSNSPVFSVVEKG